MCTCGISEQYWWYIMVLVHHGIRLKTVGFTCTCITHTYGRCDVTGDRYSVCYTLATIQEHIWCHNRSIVGIATTFHSFRKFSPFQHYPWLIGWPIHIWGDDPALCGSCPTWIVCFYMLNALKVMSALLFTNYLSELINILFQELLLWVFLTVKIIPHLIIVTLTENINLKLELCPTPSIEVSRAGHRNPYNGTVWGRNMATVTIPSDEQSCILGGRIYMVCIRVGEIFTLS